MNRSAYLWWDVNTSCKLCVCVFCLVSGHRAGTAQTPAAVFRHACSGGQRQLLHRQEVRRHKLDHGPGKVCRVRGHHPGQRGQRGEDSWSKFMFSSSPENQTRLTKTTLNVSAGVEKHDGCSGGAQHQQEPGGLGHGRQHRGLQRSRRQHRSSHLHRLWAGNGSSYVCEMDL